MQSIPSLSSRQLTPCYSTSRCLSRALAVSVVAVVAVVARCRALSRVVCRCRRCSPLLPLFAVVAVVRRCRRCRYFLAVSEKQKSRSAQADVLQLQFFIKHGLHPPFPIISFLLTANKLRITRNLSRSKITNHLNLTRISNCQYEDLLSHCAPGDY